jgi:hypothetical protein
MPRKQRNNPFLEFHDVSIEYEGRIISGAYCVRRGLVSVSTGYCGGGSKSTQVGGSTPAGLARIMLRELAQELSTEASSNVRFRG